MNRVSLGGADVAAHVSIAQRGGREFDRTAESGAEELELHQALPVSESVIEKRPQFGIGEHPLVEVTDELPNRGIARPRRTWLASRATHLSRCGFRLRGPIRAEQGRKPLKRRVSAGSFVAHIARRTERLESPSR